MSTHVRGKGRRVKDCCLLGSSCLWLWLAWSIAEQEMLASEHTLKRSGSDGGRRRRGLLLGGGGGGRDAAGICSGVWGPQRVFSSSEEDIFLSFLAVVFLDVEVEMSAWPKRRREEEGKKRKTRR